MPVQCVMFFGLQVDRGNLAQAVSDNMLDDLGLNTNGMCLLASHSFCCVCLFWCVVYVLMEPKTIITATAFSGFRSFSRSCPRSSCPRRLARIGGFPCRWCSGLLLPSRSAH